MRNRFSKHLSCVLCAVLVTVALLGSSTVALSQGTEKILEVWRPSNNEAIEGFWQAQVDAFNTQYAGQYKVVQSTFPKSGDQGYSNKVSAAVLSQTLPDLMLVDGPNVSNYAINEMIIPLDSYISAESKADLLDSIITQGTYNEKLYAVGLWESTTRPYWQKLELKRLPL
jgi:fructooligosaccharide transport system substrate-binding protein